MAEGDSEGSLGMIPRHQSVAVCILFANLLLEMQVELVAQCSWSEDEWMINL